ncbi:MAG TPA: universal stress protein [Candidatus Bathyarchaeia archaeon]|nr:universal stress protein [Candidatus Bathyarchaeia archaeon]
MKRILAAVDLTQYAPGVVSQAIELATLTKSDLTLLSVINSNPLSTSTMKGEEERLRTLHRELIVKNFPAKTLKPESGRFGPSYVYGPNAEVRINSRIEHGDVVDKICACANEIDADLIILGTRGLGEIGSLVGSVSEKVVRKASSSVMVVKHDQSAGVDTHSHKSRHARTG